MSENNKRGDKVYGIIYLAIGIITLLAGLYVGIPMIIDNFFMGLCLMSLAGLLSGICAGMYKAFTQADNSTNSGNVEMSKDSVYIDLTNEGKEGKDIKVIDRSDEK